MAEGGRGFENPAFDPEVDPDEWVRTTTAKIATKQLHPHQGLLVKKPQCKQCSANKVGFQKSAFGTPFVWGVSSSK